MVAVAIFGGTFGLLALIESSRRVLGWMIAAAIVAALLEPVVDALAKRMPRGAAIGLVSAVVVAVIAVVVYGVVENVAVDLHKLERAAPKAARELARWERFSDLAKEIRLVDRVDDFVQEVPRRLRGGDAPDAIRAAATRGIAFLATGVFTLFLLIHGRHLVASGVRQLPAHQRLRVERVGAAAYRRAARYARRSIVKSLLAALVTYGLARLAGVPGAAPLGIWMALWNLVPFLGSIVGGLPVVVLALAFSSEGWTATLIVAFLAYQVIDGLVLTRWVESGALRVGPFLALAAGLVGVELYGIGGAVVSLLAVVAALAVIDEAAPNGTVVPPGA